MSKNESFVYKYRYFILFLSCIFTSLLNIFTAWHDKVKLHNQVLFFIGVIFVFLVYCSLFKNNTSFSERDIVFIIFSIGFVFRVVYTQSTGYLVRQHDVGGNFGHLQYIMNIYNDNGLLYIDVSKYWQYYQPPVWHTLCAYWLKFQTFIGVEMSAALENLQQISLFCSSALMLISHKLFKMFGLKNAPLCFACAIVAFHPTFIILSGSINNDVLSLMLSLLSVVIALKWYREPKFSTIIALGFSIGLSMGVKLSGGLISLGVAILFAIRLFGKTYKNKLKLIGQFASFGVICIPLALWWQIRNLVKFDIPITYVPMLSETNSQYIGWRTVSERLFDFSSVFDIGVYPARIPRGYEFFEYNIPLGALKSSVFGEYYIGRDQPFLEFFANVLFWSAAVLAIISVIAAVFIIITAVKKYKNSENKHKNSLSELIFPFICTATFIISYTKFCFDYAHFCTMDFRYIAITVVFGALYIGLLLKNQTENNKMFGKVLVYIIGAAVCLMSISSMILYGSIA